MGTLTLLAFPDALRAPSKLNRGPRTTQSNSRRRQVAAVRQQVPNTTNSKLQPRQPPHVYHMDLKQLSDHQIAEQDDLEPGAMGKALYF